MSQARNQGYTDRTYKVGNWIHCPVIIIYTGFKVYRALLWAYKSSCFKELAAFRVMVLCPVTSELYIFQSCFCCFDNFIAFLALDDHCKFWSTVMRRGFSISGYNTKPFCL